MTGDQETQDPREGEPAAAAQHGARELEVVPRPEDPGAPPQGLTVAPQPEDQQGPAQGLTVAPQPEDQQGLTVAPQPEDQQAPAQGLTVAPQPPEPVTLDPQRLAELRRIVEALLFLSADPVSEEALAGAAEAETDEIRATLAQLGEDYEREVRGLVLRHSAAGWYLASHPDAEDAARNLLARPRTPPLTAAQAETLAIIAYLQPVSRPEIARIRGVNAESAATTLLERGLIEESGRSQFGAVLYRTTDLFLRLFGLGSLTELPPISAFDPSPELEEELRERLLRAGEARTGG